MVLNIAAYHFAVVDDPDALARALHAEADRGDVRGTILVAPEGVNLFLAGEAASVDAVLDILAGDGRFEGLQVKRSWSRAQPFARL